MPPDVVSRVIELMEYEGLVVVKEERVYPKTDPLDVVLWVARRYGIDPESVLENVNWQLFETFTVRAFKEAGFKVKSRCRFTIDNKRYELDVLAWREGIMLAIDCKHWRRSGGWRLRRAVVVNLRRVEAFSKVAKEKLGFSGRIYPVLITLKDTPIRIHEGSAIVPVFRLRDFIADLHVYLEDLKYFQAVG